MQTICFKTVVNLSLMCRVLESTADFYKDADAEAGAHFNSVNKFHSILRCVDDFSHDVTYEELCAMARPTSQEFKLTQLMYFFLTTRLSVLNSISLDVVRPSSCNHV